MSKKNTSQTSGQDANVAPAEEPSFKKKIEEAIAKKLKNLPLIVKKVY